MGGPSSGVEAVARRFMVSCVGTEVANVATLDEEPDDLSELLRGPPVIVVRFAAIRNPVCAQPSAHVRARTCLSFA